MSLLKNLRERFHRDHVTLDLGDIQALILRARPEPYVGAHIMLHIDDAAGGRALIGKMVPLITSAANWTDDLRAWTGVALSYAGLKALELPDAVLQSFPLPFQQGMAARARQLHDFGVNAAEHWDEVFTPGNCHLALTIYAEDQSALDEALAKARTIFSASSGVTLMGLHEFGAPEGAKNPFGFRDSISQPTVAGSGVAPQPGQERAIAAGEFILGQVSENGQALALPQPADLGRNGSFVVLRKYDSQVGKFNDFVKAHAESEEAQERLAAKMFGRWRSGAPLVLAPEHDDPELGADPLRNNDFDFSDDAKGMMCPHSSHMRRLNPRDDQLTILTDVNIHRIIRRSSTFGPVWSADVTAEDDSKRDRGLYFIFISARAYDTIEFMQQEWINRGNFIDLGTERDPIVGLHEEPGRFTVPEQPVRERVDGVSTFNILRGGEYMFMPSLTALEWLASSH